MKPTKRVRDRYARMIEITQKKLDAQEAIEEQQTFLPHYRQMLLELVEVRRRELNRFRHTNTYSEELIREREWELDFGRGRD